MGCSGSKKVAQPAANTTLLQSAPEPETETKAATAEEATAKAAVTQEATAKHVETQEVPAKTAEAQPSTEPVAATQKSKEAANKDAPAAEPVVEAGQSKDAQQAASQGVNESASTEAVAQDTQAPATELAAAAVTTVEPVAPKAEGGLQLAEDKALDAEPSNFVKEPAPTVSDLIEEGAKAEVPTVVVSSAPASGQKGWFMCCAGESQTDDVVKA